MSVLRQDPTTKEWVIIAPQRARRPDQFDRALRTQAGDELPGREASCPFCPGNEALTPPELLRLPVSGDSHWQVRVVPNKFAALAGAGPAVRREAGPLFREMDGVGSHEVVIETPAHNSRLALMTDREVELVLQACRTRARALRKRPQIKSVMIFKNHGEHAGTSLRHPHMQIVATPVAPLLIRRKFEVAIAYYDDTGRCLYGDVVEAELKAGTRIVLETDRFVVFQPFASRLPFETWIMPRQVLPSFDCVPDEDLGNVAAVLRRTLWSLDGALRNPDFNLVIHSAPTTGDHHEYFSWHIQILPRLTAIAGFELGSGIFINTMVPEDCATILRQSCRAS